MTGQERSIDPEVADTLASIEAEVRADIKRLQEEGIEPTPENITELGLEKPVSHLSTRYGIAWNILNKEQD